MRRIFFALLIWMAKIQIIKSTCNIADVKDPKKDDCCASTTQEQLSSKYISKDSEGTCLESDQPLNLLRCYNPSYCLLKTSDPQKCVDLNVETKYTGYNTNSECIQDSDTFNTQTDAKCLNSGVCLYTDPQTQLYSCKTLTIDTAYEAKKQDNSCANKGQSSTDLVECAFGYMCRSKDIQSGQTVYSCQKFLYKRDNNIAGRGVDGNCFDAANAPATPAVMCAMDFCLTSSGTCQQLNLVRFIGREKDTSNCIEIGQTGKIADSCAKGYCLHEGTCLLLTITKELSIGVQQDVLAIGSQAPSANGDDPKFQKCIFQQIDKQAVIDPYKFKTSDSYFKGIINDEQAEKCATKQYCLNASQKCERVGSNTNNYCLKADESCAADGQCIFCSYNTCKKASNLQYCVVLEQSPVQCQTQNETCASDQDPACVSCPDNYCYDNTSAEKKCLKMEEIDVDYDKCIIRRFGFQTCQYVDMNARKEEQKLKDLYCADKDNSCALIYQQSQSNPLAPNNVCLRCPDSFKNPGNKICYQDSQSGSNTSNSGPFGLNILIEFDVYDEENEIKYDNRSSTTCFLQKNGICVQCFDRYFLRDGKCIACPTITPSFSTNVADFYKQSYANKYSELFTYTKPQQPTPILNQECQECIMSTGDWNSDKVRQYFNCQNYILSYYQNMQQIDSINLLQSFTLGPSNLSIQLYTGQSNQPDQNLNDCKIKKVTENGNLICVKCESKFALDKRTDPNNPKCKQCNPQCEDCYYGGLYDGQMIDWSSPPDNLKDLDVTTLKNEQYQLLCRACKSPFIGYTLKQTFTDCEKCGNNCDYCYWGNSSFNLTSKHTIYSTDYIDNLKLTQKCVKCADGYVFDKNLIGQQICVRQIANCQQTAFAIINKNNNTRTGITIHPWFSTQEPLFQECLLCSKKIGQFAAYNVDTKSCVQYTTNPNSSYQNCEVYDNIGSSIFCKLCDNQNYLDLDSNSNKFQKCDNKQCRTLVHDCERCYMYRDKTQSPPVEIYQCLECGSSNKIPSINGCVECPTGCKTCYEGNSQFNFTAFLMYDRPTDVLTLEKRLFYQSQYDTKFICTSCEDGYVLDIVEKTCVYKNCGPNCSVCDYSGAEPQCLVCNVKSLIAPISSLLGYIGQFYFQATNFDYSMFVSFTSDKTDCQLCPIWCNGCASVTIGDDPYNLYNAKCYGCKKDAIITQYLTPKQSLMNFDRNRQRCYFCEKTNAPEPNNAQLGCHYKKKVSLTIQCNSISDPIINTINNTNNTDEINLQRGNEVDWDSQILSMNDLSSAFVQYNEIGVREITVVLQIKGKPPNNSCSLNSRIIISSQIANKIKSLEKYKLEIIGDEVSPTSPQKLKLILNGMLVFEGFQEIEMHNFEISPYNEDSVKQYGFSFSSTRINKVQLYDMKFLRTKKGQIPSALNIQFTNLYQYLNLTNVEFDFIYMNKVNLIQTSYTDVQQTFKESMKIVISKTTLNYIDLEQANFLSIDIDKTDIILDNVSLKHCSFTDASQLFQYNIASSTSIVNIDMQTFGMNNVTLNSASYIFEMSQLKSWYARGITISKCTFVDSKYRASVFIANGANINDLTIKDTTFRNYCLLKTPSVISSNNLYGSSDLFRIYNVIFSSNTIFVPGSILMNLQGYTVSKNSVILRQFEIVNNKFNMEPEDQNLITVSTFNNVQISHFTLSNLWNTNALISSQVYSISYNTIACYGTDYTQFVKKCISLTDFHNTAIIKNISLREFKTQTTQVDILMQIDIQGQTSSSGVWFENILMEKVFLYQDLAFENLAGLYYFSSSSLPIYMDQITVRNNTLDAQGKKIYGKSSSGLYINSFLSQLQFVNGLFENNTALQSKNGLAIESENVSIKQVVFQFGNEYVSESDILNEIQGGLVYIISSYLKVDESTFQSSKAQSGALYWQALGNATASIYNSIFQNNTASFSSLKSQGGAIYVETQYSDEIRLDFKNNQFMNNFAIYDGAAIFIQNFKKKAIIKMTFNTFIDNFSSNGACLDALLHENSMSDIDLSQNYFSFSPGNNDKIKYINDQLETSDRSQNSFIALQGFNRTRFENNEFFLDVFDKDYNFVMADIELQQVVFQSWILVMKSQYFLDLASKFTASTVGKPLIITEQLTQFQLINTVISNLNSVKEKLTYFANGKDLIEPTSLISISSQSVEIVGLQSQDLKCNTCSKGNIYIESFILNIRSSLFQRNQAQKGAGLYLAKLIGTGVLNNIVSGIQSNYLESETILLNFGNQNRILDVSTINVKIGQRKIESSQFYYNQAQEGGAIYIDTIQIDVNNTEFLSNTALTKGGAIYYNLQANEDVQQNQIFVYKSIFIRNSADIGGAIYSSGNLVKIEDDPLLMNTFSQNVGRIYGSDKIENPIALQIRSNDKVYKDKFTINNHNSGLIKDEILVQFINKYGEIYTAVDSESSVQLNLKISSSQQNEGIVTPEKLDFTKNYFNLTQAISVIGKFDKNLTIELSSPFIKVPIIDPVSKNITSYSSTYKFEFNVYIRSCLAGEEQQVIEDKFDTCVSCISPTYNLEEKDQCKKCPLADAYCEGSTILLPPGYWRYNSTSDDILECINLVESCVGDLNRTDPKSIKRSYQNQYCFEGHIGLRCEDCDILGNHWQGNYQKSGKYKCADCSKVSGNVIKLIVIQFSTILLTGFFVKSTIDLIQKKILQKIIPPGRKEQAQGESGIYIKIFMNYIQIIQTLFTFNLQIPEAFSSIFQYTASPIENALMAQDCFLVGVIDKFMDRENMLYFRIIISQLQIVATFIVFYLSFLAVAQIFRWKTSSAVIYCALNYIFISNQPGIFNLIVGSFSCTDTKKVSFVKDYVSYVCDDTHTLWKYSLMLPLIMLWAFIIPATQYLILRKAAMTPKDGMFQKKQKDSNEEEQGLLNRQQRIHELRSKVTPKETMLDSSKIRYALGFIYLEYRKETFYWEIIKILEKMFIIFVLNNYDSEIKLKGILCFIIIFGYGLISLKYRPYSREQLNSVDFWSSNICALSLVLGVMLSSAESNQVIQYIGYSFIILINLVFVLWIVKIILSAYLEQFDELVNKVKIFLVKMYPSLKPILKPREFDPLKIKLIWDSLRLAILDYAENKKEQKQHNILLTNPQRPVQYIPTETEHDQIIIERKKIARDTPEENRNRIQSPLVKNPRHQIQWHNVSSEEQKDLSEKLSDEDSDKYDSPSELVKNNFENINKNIGKTQVKQPIQPIQNQNFEELYYKKLKEAFKDIEYQKLLKIKEREMVVEFDLTNIYANPEALKNHIKSKRKDLKKKLSQYIEQYSQLNNVVEYFEELKKDIDEKYKLLHMKNQHKDIATYLLHYENMMELQVKIIQITDKNKKLFYAEKQNNIEQSDTLSNIQDLLDYKKKYEDGKLERTEFLDYMSLYEMFIDLKTKAEEIILGFRIQSFANNLEKCRASFTAKTASAYNREILANERKQYRLDLEFCKKEIDLFLEINSIQNKPVNENNGSSLDNYRNSQSPDNGSGSGIKIEMQHF